MNRVYNEYIYHLYASKLIFKYATQMVMETGYVLFPDASGRIQIKKQEIYP